MVFQNVILDWVTNNKKERSSYTVNQENKDLNSKSYYSATFLDLFQTFDKSN